MEPPSYEILFASISVVRMSMRSVSEFVNSTGSNEMICRIMSKVIPRV